MIKKLFIYIMVLAALLSCTRDVMEAGWEEKNCLPDGTPVTLLIPFGSTELYQVEVKTRAEATKIDESRIHDLYVMIFDRDNGKKIYGRFFSYDHLKGSLAEMNSDDHECWYVDNVNTNLESSTNPKDITQTKGAVKVSTITCANAKLVVVANVENAVTNMDGMNELERLNAVESYDELRGIQVRLEQDVVNRKDLFLMTGELNVNTNDMVWGSISGSTVSYSGYTVSLSPVDAKVRFRVKVNPIYISAVTPVYWQVCNTPDRCYLYSDYAGGATPDGINHFESQQYYFEGKETGKRINPSTGKEEIIYETDPETGDYLLDPVTGDKIPETWYVFSFYMLENRQTPNSTATQYYQRELREKIDSGDSGYKGPTGTGNEAFSNHYVNNGDWRYAPTFGTYVRFDMILTLTEKGITNIGSEDPEGMTITQALTSDAIFTVHLGDFSSSDTDNSSKLNNYQTLRSNCYTYSITVNNTRSIYTEVKRDEEVQSGQEGFLLLTDSEIINADCHYEYHEMEFLFRDLDQRKYSWYVKTPFGEGGPKIIETDGKFTYDARGLDYKWVLFGINGKVARDYTPSGSETDPDPVPWYSDKLDAADGDGDGYVLPYTKKRHAFPGSSHYHPEWVPRDPDPRPGHEHDHQVKDKGEDFWKDTPDLMDITQLIQYIFYQTDKQKRTGISDFIADDADAEYYRKPVIRVTAFIDEFYYDHDPLNPSAPLDPDLWRKFVNAMPRELHVLSDAQSSRDRNSDVILSSHSIIQQSIQTIYNVYAADLPSLWGTEHTDEMREKSLNGWIYWPATCPYGARWGNFSTNTGKENGRLNSAYIWDLYSSDNNSGVDYTDTLYTGEKRRWDTYIDYGVTNNTPELNEAYQGMAWSCLARNRDNNGNGVIDRDEVRWYLAACNQLIGMWIGNESLSVDSRLYRPARNQWRAHIISSTGAAPKDKRPGPKISWAEEGAGATDYYLEIETECWGKAGLTDDEKYVLAAQGESVRCLRNIGTYNDGSGTKDITGAPYDVMPERYFTITPKPNENLTRRDSADIHYKFSFERLNPKSLRELSLSDLPFSNQFSINNCVYIQMETQSRQDEMQMHGADDAYPAFDYPYSLLLDELNYKIDKLGYNPYCPPGYRFPNQSELVLMSVYLPETYFTRGETNAEKDKNPTSDWMPSRTYYDRGSIGQITDGFEYDHRTKPTATSKEREKIGWGYTVSAKKNRAARSSNKITRSRCVRDIDNTGTIDGGILIKKELYPGDKVPLTFSFNSTGSTFISASLKFCFTDGDGTYHERDIPIQKTPTGLQFLAEQTYTIPTLASLGVTEEQLDTVDPVTGKKLREKTKFKITIRNAYASQTFEQPFTLGNPLDASLTLADNNTELYPSDSKYLGFNVSSVANTCELQNVTLRLKYRNHSDEETTKTLTIPAVSTDSLTYRRASAAVPVPGLGSGDGTLDLLFADIDPSHRTATLELTVTDKGGSTKTASRSVTIDNPLAVTEDITLSDALNGKIYPSNHNAVSLSVRSKANTININSARLYLCPDGDDPIEITGIPAASARTYVLTDETINIPSATTLSLDNAALDAGKAAILRLVFSAPGGFTKSIDSDALTISHPLEATTFTINATDNKIYPGDQNSVNLVFTSMGNNPPNLSTVTLQLFDNSTGLAVGDPIYSNGSVGSPTLDWSGTFNIPSLTDLGLSVGDLDPGTTYILRATVTAEGGLSRSREKTLTLSNPISGSFSVPVGYVYPADDNTLNFNVSSQTQTSTLSSVSFKVTYTGIDGSTHNVDSGFTGPSPSGKSYSGDKTVSFPALTATPATNAPDLSLPITLIATFTAPGGITKDITCDVPIHSHINAPVLQIPSDYSSSPSFVFPVNAKLGDAVVGYAVSEMKLQWKKNGETTWTTDTYDFDESNAAFQTVSDASTRASLSLSTGSYINYRALSICSTDGTVVYSPIWSMWLARYAFVKSDTDKWYFQIQNLNIPDGDFIQASITETGGYDVEKKKETTKYELIGFGIGETAEAAFYPQPKSSNPYNAIHVQRRETNKLQVYGWWRDSGGWRYKKFGNFTNPIYINVLFNKDGLYYQNGNLFDPTIVDGRDNDDSTKDDLSLNISNLINATSMWVGSAQGVERPYATYHFVRVVRQYEIPEP